MKEQKTKLVRLKPVTKPDYLFLYQLLVQRHPIVNISHKKMPAYEEHVKFVKSKPYSKWYIIILETRKVGAAYLSKQNEIGIHLMRKYEKKYIYLQTIKELMKKNPRKKFLANVSPRNKKYIQFFKKFGFKLLQHTYELDKRLNF